MNYLWLTLRGFAFWLGAFYAFTLAWGTLELSFLPRGVSPPLMLAPVAALIFGAVLPDKALSGGRQMEFALYVVLIFGAAGAVATGVDDYLARNTEGILFQVLAVVMMLPLGARPVFIRKHDTQPARLP